MACRTLLASTTALALAACHPAEAPMHVPAAPSSGAPAHATPGRLQRLEVDRVLVEQGPPWVLRRVLSEEVVRKDGKFAGWRLVGLPEAWRSIDLKPGDVVTRVNGLPLETPDDAWEAWKSVAKATAIKVSLWRDGAARELVLPIDGPPAADTLKLLGREAPASRASTPAPKRGSVQLGGASAPEAPEEDTY